MKEFSAVRKILPLLAILLSACMGLLLGSGCASITDGLSVMMGMQHAQAVALNNQALKEKHVGRSKEAFDLFDRALKLSPYDPIFWINRGVYYCDLDRYPEAYADFAQAARVKADETVNYTGVGPRSVAWAAMDSANRAGQALMRQGDYVKAYEWFTTAMQMGVGDPCPFYNRALCRYRQNDLNSAWQDFNTFLGADPRYEPLVPTEGLLLLEERRVQEFKAAETAGIEAERQGDLGAAFQSYSRMYALTDPIFSDDGDAAQRSKDAVIRVWRNLPVKPRLSEAARRYQVQSESYARDGNYAAVVETSAKAVAVAPWFATAYFNQALALANLNRYPEAVASMQEFVRLAPEDPSARQAQDKVYEWQAKMTGAAGAGQATTQVPAIVGSWQWFNGGIVTLDAAGQITDAGGTVVGSWVYDTSRYLYILNWFNGKYIDTLSLTGDGRTLSGHNQMGVVVSGSKL